MSEIRIITHDGKLIVSIDVETGKVTHADGADLDQAAHAFWGAVSVAAELFRQKTGYQPNVVEFQGAPNGPSVVDTANFHPGPGGAPGGKGGDLTITLPSTPPDDYILGPSDEHFREVPLGANER